MSGFGGFTLWSRLRGDSESGERVGERHEIFWSFGYGAALFGVGLFLRGCDWCGMFRGQCRTRELWCGWLRNVVMRWTIVGGRIGDDIFGGLSRHTGHAWGEKWTQAWIPSEDRTMQSMDGSTQAQLNPEPMQNFDVYGSKSSIDEHGSHWGEAIVNGQWGCSMR